MWSNIMPYTLTTIWAHIQNLINCYRLGKCLSYHFRSRNDWVTGTWSSIWQDFEWIRCNVELWTSHQFGTWDKFIMIAFPSYLRRARSENLVSRDWWTICYHPQEVSIFKTEFGAAKTSSSSSFKKHHYFRVAAESETVFMSLRRDINKKSIYGVWMVNHPNGCRHRLLLTGFKTSDIWKCIAKFLIQTQMLSINASQPRCFSKFVTPLCQITINYFMRSITRSLETGVLKRRLRPALPQRLVVKGIVICALS